MEKSTVGFLECMVFTNKDGANSRDMFILCLLMDISASLFQFIPVYSLFKSFQSFSQLLPALICFEGLQDPFCLRVVPFPANIRIFLTLFSSPLSLSFSYAEPTILLACGRDQELWLVPKYAQSQ